MRRPITRSRPPTANRGTSSTAAATGGGLPNTLGEAIEHRSVDVLSLFVDQRLEIASSGEYGWVADLKDIGYSSAEIAQLLLERANDSPWIYFESQPVLLNQTRSGHHIEGCAHQVTGCLPREGLRPSVVTESDREVIRLVEERCGLGGIAPSSRDVRQWNATVGFKSGNSVGLFYHGVSPSSTASHHDMVSRLLRVAENCGAAFRTVQDAGFCCHSFTILRIPTIIPDTTSPELQLLRVDFSLVAKATALLRLLRRGSLDDPRLIIALDGLRVVSQNILSHPLGQSHLFRVESSEDILNMASLALQFMCLGFLSYAQAHVGMLQPFFLDTPIRQIKLQGTQAEARPEVHIEARLVELTCLSGMCQGPVLAFGGPNLQHNLDEMSSCKYNVRALPEDILDTWGPGELVYEPIDKEIPLAIKVGGGYICPPLQDNGTGMYHWHEAVDLRLASSSAPFKLHEKIVIGSLIVDNQLCHNDEKKCWQDSAGRFDELGVYNSYSEVSELQGGFQVGFDHLSVTSNVVWAKRRGRTIKDKAFETGACLSLSFLEFYWGIRVSFCTGVAQRVLLRELVADVLPAFAECYPNQVTKSLWAELLSLTHNIIHRFKATVSHQVPLSAWVENLREDLRAFVRMLIRHILCTLKDTGLSPDGKHFAVSWPQSGFVNRCLRVSVNEHNRWMPMLADSVDCATFAYTSNTCLEVGSFKCRGPNPSWQGRVHILETAVHCPANRGSWALQPEQAYFFQKVNNTLFWVKARMDAAEGTLPVALIRDISIRTLPRDVVARLLFSGDRRMQRWVRERDLTCVAAENVSVL
ncbi:WD repeat-containing [Fusarium albosuccineum]|uniref:WD repeat-containing n=1 Tax=Fusarium albosuccineum TaxID=1237068 RepID=A0A8H4P6R1_9HYPO|nr:WD repeat-containing [Fusarium albosuccineum]